MWVEVSTTPRPLYPWKRPGTHCTGSWVVPRAGLDGWGKSRLYRNSIPGRSGPWRIAVPTELSQPPNPGFATTLFHIIQVKFSTPYRLAPQAAAQVVCPLIRHCLNFGKEFCNYFYYKPNLWEGDLSTCVLHPDYREGLYKVCIDLRKGKLSLNCRKKFQKVYNICIRCGRSSTNRIG